MDTRVKTVTGPTSIMVRVEVQRQWEGDLCGGWTRGCKAPLGRVSKEGGYPLIPLFSRERTGWMGRHMTRGIRGWSGAGLTLSAVGLSRWQTSPITGWRVTDDCTRILLSHGGRSCFGWVVDGQCRDATIIAVPQTKADYQRQGVLDPQVWKPVGARDRLLLVQGD